MSSNNELNMYEVKCDNIDNLLNHKQAKIKEVVPVNITNDNKYRELRKIIVQQKKIIKEQDDKIRTLLASSN